MVFLKKLLVPKPIRLAIFHSSRQEELAAAVSVGMVATRKKDTKTESSVLFQCTHHLI
jgi:hypothetical protein